MCLVNLRPFLVSRTIPFLSTVTKPSSIIRRVVCVIVRFIFLLIYFSSIFKDANRFGGREIQTPPRTNAARSHFGHFGLYAISWKQTALCAGIILFTCSHGCSNIRLPPCRGSIPCCMFLQ